MNFRDKVVSAVKKASGRFVKTSRMVSGSGGVLLKNSVGRTCKEGIGNDGCSCIVGFKTGVSSFMCFKTGFKVASARCSCGSCFERRTVSPTSFGVACGVRRRSKAIMRRST